VQDDDFLGGGKRQPPPPAPALFQHELYSNIVILTKISTVKERDIVQSSPATLKIASGSIKSIGLLAVQMFGQHAELDYASLSAKLWFHVKIKLLQDPSRRHQSTVLFFLQRAAMLALQALY